MLDPQTARMLKETLGISDAELADLAPRLEGLMALLPQFEKVRIIAEVMSSVNCFAGVKKGQKLVFNIMPFTLNMAETTCPLCVRALTPVMVPTPRHVGVGHERHPHHTPGPGPGGRVHGPWPGLGRPGTCKVQGQHPLYGIEAISGLG